MIISHLASKLWGEHLGGSSVQRVRASEPTSRQTVLGKLTEDEPHNSGLLNCAQVWVALLDNDIRKQQDGAADGGESSKQHWDAPFVGEEGGDADLSRKVVVVGDEGVGEVANDFGGCGGHLCG